MCCCCCECGCYECYDACCDRCCCGCVSYDTRETIFYCAVCLLLVAAVVLLAVLLAAYGFIRHVSITVESASLTRFNLSSPSEATALAYNLSLTLAVRNKNWAMSIKNTKDLEAGYSFDGQRFERVKLAGEGEKHPAGKTRVYHLDSSSDNAYAALGNAGVAEFKKENATGVFEVEVAVTGEVRYQAHYTKCKLAATCPLKLQLAPPGTPAVVFQKVKCKLAAADKNC
ncbi:NDR1/HIN1-like protein 2 [Oryza sativa Japonica Group]|jgi:hypothetical protein|uniref:Os07g0250900 protein n=2 Tax=Oryza sativa subsp. japonica TaxID=39947 RepID=A0A0P0X4U4_ORYSJ|nr:uncharacterized protein LOC4342843 [Oryza sativa Japonica Group]KAB8104942.1 hypothetical protein EE612_038215 [Oryza sativa]KAF2922154.1 hypothetical protein DAI22_07g090500 [Oryza sativa Japonica Group]BAC20128.1 unknown protein [Oryza sativa Japonica Group]BAC20826.1 unknown protein [Oryza sativa Japonica Group]BAF21212.1 Os07g0250900 [Oryza sativa Japonica Group]|eukprot:NP_001059298.1 Os07g0250900 [Oryza sativa Japonica Group]